MVIAAGLGVLRISEPPRTTVGRLPRALLTDGAFHRMIRTPAATVGTASHIHNQVGCFGIVREVLAQSVVHESPVVLVARRPNLPSSRTRIRFCALRHLQTVGNPLDEVATRVSRDWYTGDFTVCCTARGTFHWSVVCKCVTSALIYSDLFASFASKGKDRLLLRVVEMECESAQQRVLARG